MLERFKLGVVSATEVKRKVKGVIIHIWIIETNYLPNLFRFTHSQNNLILFFYSSKFFHNSNNLLVINSILTIIFKYSMVFS